MSCNHLDIHIAKHKMRLKSTRHSVSFVTTLWKGEIIMFSFSHLSKEIVNAFCAQILEPEDLQTLEWLVQDFISVPEKSHKSLA